MSAKLRILNIGCGFETYGTDYVDKYPQRDGVLACDINQDKLPYKDETFDEVYSRCIFEHLTNHDNFMKEATRVLKKGGKLDLTTDNACYIGWWIARLKYHYYEGFGPDDNHYCLFTEFHLKNFCKKYGYNTPKITYVSIEAEHIIKKIAFRILPKEVRCVRIRLEAQKREVGERNEKEMGL